MILVITRSDGQLLVKAINETNVNSFNNFKVFQSLKMPLLVISTDKSLVITIQERGDCYKSFLYFHLIIERRRQC